MIQHTPEQALIVAQIAIKMRALGIKAEISAINAGPVVTTYSYALSIDTPINKIMKAEEDIALATKAPSVLISRHGGTITIAIPNKEKAIVDYDTCLNHMFLHNNFDLPIMLGVDPMGQPAFMELTECPHFLLAGTTGAGKSVFLAAVISALASRRSRAEMKLILFDTKQLDLTLFKNLPHVVEMADTLEEVRRVLDRLLIIVRQRTEKMRGIARNIREFNAISPTPLPHYVVVIDELADIVLQDRSKGKGVRGYEKAEQKLQQLLQISRAAGVHVICATQRPSVEIITGDIKANLPTRIALRLPTAADSRTVITGGGAEKLLGKGDMLIESPIYPALERFHGPYVSMSHISNVLVNCDEIRKSYDLLKMQP